MPNCYSISICQLSSDDKQSNNLSLFNCLEELSLLDFDIAYPFEVISFWMVEPEFFEKEFKVKYRLTNDQLKIKLDTDLLSVPLRKYERVRVRTIGLKFPKVDGYCKLEAIIVNEKGEEILQTPYWWIKLKPQFNE